MEGKADQYSAPLPESSAPPQYEIRSPLNANESPQYGLQTTQYEVQSEMVEDVSEKPIVVPRESTTQAGLP
jgi:hypothetical protein